MTMEQPAEGVRLVGLAGLDVTAAPAPVRRSRGGGAPQADAIIDSALDSAGLDVVAHVEVAPSAAPPEAAERRRMRGVAAAPEPAPRVEVDVAPGESAVLLVERGGSVFNWVFPDELPAEARRARGAGPQTLTFTIPAEAAGPPTPDEQRRSLAGALVNRLVEPIRVRIARFAADLAIDALVDKIEGHLVEGPIVMEGPALGWVAQGAQLPARPALPVGRPARVLLFVHGTFSTVRGSFGALEQTDAGRAFLDGARGAYDLLIGVDHKTLAADPADNAELFAQALAFLPEGTEIDAIGFSRGGLVLRSVVAKLNGRFAFGKLVFVGCTNAGTHLAEPENWRTLVDLYTSILIAGSKALGAIATPLVGTVTEQAIRIIAGFVKAMPQIGIEEGKVPGLAAMRPGSETIKRLGEADALDGITAIHAVASDFHARIEPSKGLTGELAEYLIDRVVDRLFALPNDLVVDTASMTDFAGAATAPEGAQLLRLPVADAIYHIIYFATPKVAAQLHQWLVSGAEEPEIEPAPPPPAAAAPPSPPPPPSAPAEFAPPPRRSRDRGGAPSERTDFDSILEKSFGAPAMPDLAPEGFAPQERRRSWTRAMPPAFAPGEAAEAFGAGEAAAEAEPAPTEEAREEEPAAAAPPEPIAPPPEAACYFSAEMDSAPLMTRPVPLFVTVSREKIEVSGANAVALDAPVMAKTTQPLSITVTGLANCAVVGEATREVAVPASSIALRFLVQGFAAGTARIQIEIQQDGVPLASMMLEPVFLAGAADRITASAQAVPDRVAAGNAAVMRIYELRQQDGTQLIRYDLAGKVLAETYDLVLPASFSMETFVGQFLAKLDAAYNQSKTEYKLFLSRITDFAIDATNQLVPKEVRAALWEHRDKIDAVQVISDSPYMPWELLYIDDPAGGGVENRGFLSEWGLVRWMYNALQPSDTLMLRGDRVRYVIPDYLNVKDKLPQATQERELLTRLFGSGAAPVARLDGETHSESVNRFLAQEATGCDLLHFACHGEAQQMAVLNSDLVLSGEVTEKGTIADDLLGCSAVKRRAAFHDPGVEPACLVFINACQTGKPGEGISGVSGFADSFLRPVTERGAAVFVGALWSVGDSLARTFSETFYTRLLAGDTLVAAVKAARKACRTQSDFTWLAYSVYGNPFARIG